MGRFYEPKYFSIWEYVPPEIYKKYGEDAWWFVDPVQVHMDDVLREYFGVPVIINNWIDGGSRMYSGFRPCDCTVGGVLSQHRFGRASDKIFKGFDAREIQQEILKHPAIFHDIRGIELNVDWVHTDCRCCADDEMVRFNQDGIRMN